MEKIELAVTLNGADEAFEKASQLVQKINEASSLAGELASLLERLEVKV